MVVCIMQKGGACWYTTVDIGQQTEAIKHVEGMISRGEIFKIWWFAAHGQRFTEAIWIDSSEVAYLRTESDDG